MTDYMAQHDMVVGTIEDPAAMTRLLRWNPDAAAKMVTLLNTIVSEHNPIIDPDGAPICGWCVLHMPTHMWPCDLYARAADAVGVEVGDVD